MRCRTEAQEYIDSVRKMQRAGSDYRAAWVRLGKLVLDKDASQDLERSLGAALIAAELAQLSIE